MMKRNGERRNGSESVFQLDKTGFGFCHCRCLECCSVLKETLCSDWNSRRMEGKKVGYVLCWRFAPQTRDDDDDDGGGGCCQPKLPEGYSWFLTKMLSSYENFLNVKSSTVMFLHAFDYSIRCWWRSKRERERKESKCCRQKMGRKMSKMKKFLMYCAISTPLHPSAVYASEHTQCTFDGYIFDPLW